MKDFSEPVFIQEEVLLSTHCHNRAFFLPSFLKLTNPKPHGIKDVFLAARYVILLFLPANPCRSDTKDPPVARAVGAGIVHPHDDEHMLEVGADGLGGEGVSAGLLEHDGHYVVAYVALPQQLVSEKQQNNIQTSIRKQSHKTQ